MGNQKTEIGYWLSEKFQHKGIVTHSCKALIDFAFSEMNLHRIQLKAATKNFKVRLWQKDWDLLWKELNVMVNFIPTGLLI